MDERLAQLAQLAGIALAYQDVFGTEHRAEPDALIAILGAMGIAAGSPAEIEASIESLRAGDTQALLPPVHVMFEDDAQAAVAVHLPADLREAPLRWQIDAEQGELRQGELRAGSDGAAQVPVGEKLPTGYHRLSLWNAEQEIAACPLIVAPRHCYQPRAVEDGGRVWGVTAQLYALRSARNWGIGDFSDLEALVGAAAQRGASIVGVNPLHALLPHNPLHASPYSPSSRLFLNPLYLDVSRVAEAQGDTATLAHITSGGFALRLRTLRDSELVDYAGVAAAKREALDRLFAHFVRVHRAGNTARAQAFERWRQAGGETLQRHALFEALQEHFSRSDPHVWGWPVWPEAYRTPDAPEVRAFAAEHAERVTFYAYLQWLADEQLGAAGRRSYELGLGVGVYADLAVSIDRGGAEAWANQDLYAIGASAGAPPDEFNMNGQDWGLPPLVPVRLRARAYEPWIAALRANMKHAGALRIDHVMAMMRLYWVPQGASPAQGVYVHYPFEEMLALVALESQRNRCLVIGEDLGTVPGEVRRRLAEARVLSYRLLYFERDGNGDFAAPAAYPRQALVAASTHDLPTLKGWWSGRDLQHREALNLFPSPAAREQSLVQRAQDRARLLLALEREALLPEGTIADPLKVAALTPELICALHRYLARSPAQVVVAQLDDMLGAEEQANLPGTIDQHPNWRRKLPASPQSLARDERFAAAAAALAAERRLRSGAARGGPARAVIPRATYRVQFHRGFRFTDAEALVPYLADLGISHLYCSPILRARAGSQHGYDIVDHNALNPEIGSAEEFERLVATLKAHDMGLLMDIVPNHMGVLGADNAWWLDVLENGPASRFADFFDIEWQDVDPELAGRVLLPILGDQYGVVLERGEITLMFQASTGAFTLHYYDHHLPLDPATYPLVLERVLAAPEAQALQPEARDTVATLAAALRRLPARDATAPEARAERYRDKEVHKATLARLAREHAPLARAIEATVEGLNGAAVKGAAQARGAFDALDELITAQAYRLAYWRVAGDEINYRRFFDINDLAALRMENPEVFEATHRLIFELVSQGKVDGLRIDHPDGLFDPRAYFARLQARYLEKVGGTPPEDGAPPLYVVAEKIVAPHEQLPGDWPVYGTTGYRFANVITGLFIDTAARSRLDRAWRAFVGPAAEDFTALAYRCRRLVMATSLAGELTVLANALLRLARADRRTRDFTLNALRSALAEVVACFPVYRTYAVERRSQQDRRWIDWAVARARRTSRAADPSVLDFIHDVLCGDTLPDAPPELAEGYLAFTRRLQQFSAPVAAKGIEDTAFYRHQRLVALNEVGGDPDVFGFTVNAFHGASRDRAARWPHTMLATTTHDTKRSEDVRARLAVISEIPAMWRLAVRRWSRINRSHRTTLDGEPAPSRNDEYLLYQTLVGTLPHPPIDEAGLAAYRERIVQYMLKAVREAKVHSSWIWQNSEYEKALTGFIESSLGRTAGNLFLDDLREAVATFAWYGALNSLAMTLLKFTSPGVPDLYQGQETIELSLVDPDNRRPVDFAQRRAALETMRALAQSPDLAAHVAALCATPEDGRAKTWITWQALQLRSALPALFREGGYTALAVKGARVRHVVAFMRRVQDDVLVVASGRLFAQLGVERGVLPAGETWKDTRLVLTGLGPATTLRDVLTGRAHQPVGEALSLERVFGVLPFALLHGHVAR